MKIIIRAMDVVCTMCGAQPGLACTERYVLNGKKHAYYMGVPHSIRVWDAQEATNMANILKGE